MKKYLLFALNLLLFLNSCSKKDHTIKFTFLQLNDVYEIAPLEGGKVGGMARVETIHKQLLKENPNTFMFLAGDFLNPSLLGDIKYKGQRIKGKQMVEVMNAMHFSLVAFGNHEFDLTEDELQQRLNESNFKWIQTNAMHKTSEGLKPFQIIKNGKVTDIPKTVSFEIKNQQGDSIKIGFFSATVNSNPKEYVDYGNLYEAEKKAYNTLKTNNAIVFGLTHVAIDQDKHTLQLLPEVPLIMGGHEHVNMSVPVGNGEITKADANAKTVYVHRITYNTKTKKITINSELIPITDKIKEDPEVKKIVDKWGILLDEKLKTILKNPNAVIYNTKEPLDGKDASVRSKQTNLGLLITKAMAFSFNNDVDCALVNGGSIRLDDELQGGITGFDIFRVLPFGGGILKVELKGSLLKKVLEYGRLKAGEGAYLQRYNATYNQTTKTWLVNNSKIIDSKIYKVAFSDYLLKGYDIPFLKPDNKDLIKIETPDKKALAGDIRKAIINYLQSLKK